MLIRLNVARDFFLPTLSVRKPPNMVKSAFISGKINRAFVTSAVAIPPVVIIDS